MNSPFAVTSTRLAAVALLAGLAACSSITDGLAGDKVDYRTGTPKAKALEVYRAVLAIHPHAAGVSDAIERLETALQGQDL